MIKNLYKQTGGVYIIIIAISLFAAAGVLGFVFWNNFTNKKSDTVPSNITKEASVDPYKGWSDYESINSKYSIKYPKEWIALKETSQDGPYIRNFDPTSKPSNGGYPEGYINIRVIREESDPDFKSRTGYTTVDWFNALGTTQIKDGPITYSSQDVKDLKISGLPAKSAKAAFTETDEVIYVLRGDALYSINLYPYGISSDPTVKMILDSFTFIY